MFCKIEMKEMLRCELFLVSTEKRFTDGSEFWNLLEPSRSFGVCLFTCSSC